MNLKSTRLQASTPVRRSVLERATRVLSSFDQSRRFQTLADVCRSTELPLTTAHRIVSELVILGLVEKNEEGLLSIGTELWRIGLCAPKASGLQRIALPFMQDMYSATDLPIHLGVREGNEILFVENLRQDRSTDERPRLGQRYPMHVTSVGLAILAHLPESALADYLGHAHPRSADSDETRERYAIPPEASLRRDLARVRSEGFAVSDRQAEPNGVALGAAIQIRDGTPVGAISIIVPLGKENRAYAQLVRTTARSIGRLLSEPL